MILEPDRMTAEWFRGATNGINALLSSTPRDAGDPQPANVATITDETSNGEAARGELPTTMPCVAVSVDVIEDLDGQVQQVTADGRVKLRIRIGVENANSAEAVRDLSYYVRTVQRSFRRFMASDASDAARTRNGIYLETCLDMKAAIVWTKDQPGGPIVAGYVFPTLQLRDLVP